MVPLLITLGCVAPLDAEDAVVRLPLAVGATVNGVTRAEPLVVRPGLENEAVTVAVDSSGGVWSAVSTTLEAIWLRTPSGELRRMAHGVIATNPTLAAGPDGAVWLAWAGGDGVERAIFLQRVDVDSELERLSDWDGWAAHPSLAIDAEGRPHVAWETNLDTITYAFGDERAGAGSSSELYRRPHLVLRGAEVFVVFDILHERPGLDPDYDIAVWSPGGPAEVLARPGIQSAPRAVAHPDGGLVIACHDSESTGGIVKWLRLFRFDDGAWSSLEDPRAALAHEGEIQGAEFPALAWTDDGGLLVVTRSSHGHQVHAVTSDGIGEALDLTRSFWGARHWKQEVVVVGDRAHIARRARREVLVEELQLPKIAGLPTFMPLDEPLRLEYGEPGRVAGVAFGDVHMHSAFSDGTGTPDEILARAWARGLDFAVLTDHDTIVGSELSPSDHREIRRISDWFDAKPDFVTLHGYEWTTPPTWRDGSGHRNVYFRGPSTVHSAARLAPDTEALNAALADEEAFTAPHHTSWTGTDWDHFDPSIQRQFEIVSVHGLSEMPEGQPIPQRAHEGGSFASEGLARGLEFGFIAGSDGHGLRWHHGIGRIEDPWATGLTGLRCDPCTRESIWDALYARQTWATSGARMVVDLRCSGAGPGEEVSVSGSPALTWSGPATLVRDGVVLGDFVDGHVDEEAESGPHSYYIRVVQGEDVAWTSPLFVEVE